MAELNDSPRQTGRSILAVFTGFVVVFVLSLGTDQVFHMLGVYPGWGTPMYETSLNLLALGYRVVYGILGGYIVARMAPRRAMKHAMIYGWIGLGLGAIGAAGAIAHGGLGPIWYPVVLALTALPTAWAGGALAVRG